MPNLSEIRVFANHGDTTSDPGIGRRTPVSEGTAVPSMITPGLR
ncbi:hypothetical protein ACIRPU_37870 [Streptomyces sp. NPDC102259]